jgi:methylaspartate mutase epsilon subunit
MARELSSVFSSYVAAQRQAGSLIVQPRMGFGEPAKMAAALRAVRGLGVPALGTITLDSYTRQNEHDRAAMTAQAGLELNGFPLVAEGAAATRHLLDGLIQPDFPVQVRHGAPRPEQIFATMLDAGVDASEGGPVSYCLPYSRTPLRASTAAWARAARLLAQQRERGVRCHLESFGGCMLGQLCPPSLLVALSVLECLFFVELGVVSVSASYAQQTHPGQDTEALRALRRLCAEHLPAAVDWHVVLYTYMGLFPESEPGARRLLRESVRLAVRTGTERLIVKTTAEAHRIPTIAENVAALRTAHRTALDCRPASLPSTDPGAGETGDSETYAQAARLIDVVRGLAPSLAEAIPRAFERGLLDVPYCLHADNHNQTRAVIGADGRLEWWDTGQLPMPASLGGRHPDHPISAARLLTDLAYHRRRLDPVSAAPAAAGPTATR